MFDRRNVLALPAAAALAALTLNANASPVTRLVLVHGRGQAGLAADELKAAWLAALAEGAQALGERLPADLDVSLPFYGDALEDFVRKADLPLTADVASRGARPDDAFLAFQAEVAEAVRARAGITDQQILSEYGNDPRPRGVRNWAWVQAIIRAIDKHGGGLSGKALERFTRDVYLYVNVPPIRDAVDGIVRASLDDRRTVVLAHSLGTIVAYNVLRAETRSLDVPLLVTVGSPLGIRAIRNQLAPLVHPGHVGAWFNAYDRRDVVSLYPLDKDNFAVVPAIGNYGGVENRSEDHHGINGYLADAHVADKVLGALGIASVRER